MRAGAFFISAFAVTARPVRKPCSARQNDGCETLASSLPPSREILRRCLVAEHLVVDSVTAAHGVPNCPFGGAVRHLPHPSRVIQHHACGPAARTRLALPANSGDSVVLTYCADGRSQRPLPLTLRAAYHVRWGADPRRRRVLGGAVPVIESSYGTAWAVRPDPQPVIGVVGITANERDPAHAKPARAAALLAVQQIHPSSRPESMQMQAKSSRGGTRTRRPPAATHPADKDRRLTPMHPR